MKRSESKATTRGKILEAAKSCFGTLGYERSTIRDIANTAGMSTGAIFASFSGKAELYAEVYGAPPVSPEAGRELLAALATCRSRFEDYAVQHSRKATPEGEEKARANQRMVSLCEGAINRAKAA